MTTHTLPDIMAALAPLTETERQAARARARAQVVGEHDKPNRAAFAQAAISEYPAWVTRAILAMLIITFAGSFLTSAFNVFAAGRDHFLAAMPEGAGVGWQAVIVGGSIVAMAEFITIAAVLAGRILFTGKRFWQGVMIIPVVIGVTIAITGNAVIGRPSGFWPWLVTVTPPVVVVFLSLILEQIALSDIKTRHATERQYQAALADYNRKTANPDKSPDYRLKYANALKESIRAKNARGRGRQDRLELMAALGPGEWSALIYRELDSDNWLVDRAAIPANPTGPGYGSDHRQNGHNPGQVLQIPAQSNGAAS